MRRPFLLNCLVVGLFFILTLIAFRQYIFGGLVPIQFNLLPTIYSPWRNETWKGYERGVPNKPIGTDNPKLFYPYRKFTTEELKKGNIPLWNPYVFSGNVHAATYQAAVWYPLNISYLLLPQADAWSLLVLLQPILVGWFMFLFIRSQGLSSRASLFGSIAFAFSGWMIAWWEESIVIVHSILWLPLALYASTLIWEQKKKILGWGLLVSALSMSMLAGFLQMSIYLFATVLLWNGYRGFGMRRDKKSNHVLFWIGLAFIVTALVTTIQWLPALEAYGLSPRGTVAATFLFDDYLVPLRHIITLFVPDFWGNPGSYNYFFPKLFYHEKVIWMGLFPFVFALLGAGVWKDRRVRFWTLFTGIVLSLGFALPTSWMWYVLRIPVLSAALPARIFVLFAFGASVLAAYGMESWLTGQVSKRQINVLLAIITLIFIALWGFVMFTKWRLIYEPALTRETLELYGRYASISYRNLILPTFFLGVTWIMLTLRFRVSLGYAVVLVVSIIWSLYAADKFLYFSDPRFEFPENPAIAKLKALTATNYSRVWGYGDASFTPNMVSYFGLASPEGYDALFSRRYGELMNVIRTNGVVKSQIDRTDAILKGVTEGDAMDQSSTRLRLMSLLGVRYILETKRSEKKQSLPVDVRFPSSLFIQAWEDENWRIWEYKKTLPRAWFVGVIRVETDPQRIVDTIMDEQTDLSNTAIVEEMSGIIRLPLATAASGGLEKINTAISIRRYDPTLIELEVSSKAPGMVILSDTYFPGWVARVDGRVAKIYRTNYALRGIPVEMGEHTIILTYAPTSFRFGLWGTGVGLVLFVSVVLWNIRKQKHYESIEESNL